MKNSFLRRNLVLIVGALLVYFWSTYSTFSYSKFEMSSLDLSSRAEGMIVGSLVADAATMGLHWIYDQQQLQEKLNVQGASRAFYDPPSCPFYTYEQGLLSPYGDEVLPYLETFSASKSFSKEDLALKNYEFFKSYKGRHNHITKSFVENWDNGKPWSECHVEDHQAQGFVKMPLVVGRYGGDPSLSARVFDAVDTMQDSPISVVLSSHAARILEHILLTGASPAAAIRWFGEIVLPSEVSSSPQAVGIKRRYDLILSEEKMKAWTRFTVELRGLDLFPKMKLCAKLRECYINTDDLSACLNVVELDETERNSVAVALERSQLPWDGGEFSVAQEVAALGLSCALPDSYFAALLVALRSSSYQAAVEANIEAGGDNCSRGALIGGLFGGWAPESVPTEWKNKIQPRLWETLQHQVNQVVNFRD